jgi:hypothetical protein
MSLETAQKVIVPQKKIMSRIFLNSGTLIVILFIVGNIYLENSSSVSNWDLDYMIPTEISHTSVLCLPSVQFTLI